MRPYKTKNVPIAHCKLRIRNNSPPSAIYLILHSESLRILTAQHMHIHPCMYISIFITLQSFFMVRSSFYFSSLFFGMPE